VRDDAALVELLHCLKRHGYRFTTVTPATHATVVARPQVRRPDLRDVFGWNRSFDRQDLEPELFALLERARAIDEEENGELKSRIRVASLGDDLFLHSAFPTTDPDAVFFGPDTYRFARFVRQHLADVGPVARLVDMGAGSGAGGIATGKALPGATTSLIDVNATALRFSEINALAARADVELVQSDRVPDEFDLLIGNAPYLMDAAGRAYRDGGDLYGGAVSLDWVRQGARILRPGRMALLYTAAAYVDGHAPLISAIEDECRSARTDVLIEEIDPDVFGEELAGDGYGDVERIAAIGIRLSG
jgi:methylase of polypeptide subunit release factors